ncbi:phosphoribosyltransferase [Microbacterium fluvii]|uniref:Phosphoribosyltransferase n=1 Tax=Microbacterium fluvii TaxID=415215 RepID=A0ABW2HC63_9MICO|nr:phosphoribosyltransferase family protein [Microbacterium fluvii]MCU4672067.1 phosphoribosyltransferase family protein [Microbacterium fluvii]
MAIFADRSDAGRHLAQALEAWLGSDAVAVGIPRGGVVVAAEVARALDLPLAAAVVRKLGSPRNEEYAVGAIADGVRVIDGRAVRAEHVSERELEKTERRERTELERRSRTFGALGADLAQRTAIVIDDGIATGSTAAAACLAVRAQGCARLILAVPVAPASWTPPAEVDEFVCPHRERGFWAVGQYYDDFTQTTDAEVTALLGR